MRKHELEQALMIAGRSAIHQPEPGICMPDIDMETVGSRLSRSHNYSREHREQENNRVLQVATAGAEGRGGFFKHRIRMSAMAELK